MVANHQSGKHQGGMIPPNRLVLHMCAAMKIWGPRAIATVLWEIGPQFEHATGYKLDVSHDLPDVYRKRMNRGEIFDVLVSAPALIDELIHSGKIVANTRTNLVRCEIGVEVRAGTPAPNISSVAAFTRALLDAKSIAYLNVGSGIYLAELIERLGISDAIRSKVIRPDTDIVSELVAKGEVELGMVIATQILTTPGVQLVGPLPPELQSHRMFVGGVSTDSKAPETARALINFLTGPIAIPIIKAQGMEPC